MVIEIGGRINTDAGQVIILDVTKKYLVLFNDKIGQFIKANDYKEYNNKIVWGSGQYYFSLEELIKNLA